jgi:hypothetical protein
MENLHTRVDEMRGLAPLQQRRVLRSGIWFGFDRRGFIPPLCGASRMPGNEGLLAKVS